MNQITNFLTALRWTEAAVGLKPLVKASYAGHQDDFTGGLGFDLWLLDEDIPGHPMGSSVSSRTIIAAGYALPNRRIV